MGRFSDLRRRLRTPLRGRRPAALRGNPLPDTGRSVPVVPFNGSYPSYQLSLTPSAHGRVTGTESSCGAGNAQCQRTLPAAAQGHSDGNAEFRLHLHGVDRGLQRGVDDDAARQWTKTLCRHLRADRRPQRHARSCAGTVSRAPISGRGVSEVLSPGNSRWSATSLQSGNGVADSSRERWAYRSAFAHWPWRFQAPTGESLQTGRRYTGADSFPAPGVPGCSISGNGRGCGGGT